VGFGINRKGTIQVKIQELILMKRRGRNSVINKQDTRHKAVLYARVSSKEQEKEGFSIPAQRKLLNEYAAANGFEVGTEFIDVETAKQSGRVNFKRMVEYLSSSPEVRTILVEKTDRLYRNFKDYVTLEELDVEIHLVKENEVISKDSRSHAKFIHGIKLLMAKNYIDNLSEEVRKGLNEKANQGSYPCGRLPLGYIRDSITGRIDIDHDRAEIIGKLFEEYSTGKHSITSIHGLAKTYGLTYRGSGRFITRSEAERLLKKIFYTGKFVWRGKVYEGDHPPIVSESLFNTVQDVFRNSRKPVYKAKEFAFARLLSCGKCGCLITADIKKGKYIYYYCTNYHGECDREFMREEILADRLSEIVKAIEIDGRTQEWLNKALQHGLKDRAQKTASSREKLKARSNKLRSFVDKAYIDKLEGRISDEYWETKSSEWQSELSEIGIRISELENDVPANFDLGQKAIELAYRAYPLYVKQNPKEQRRLLDTLLSNCTIYNGTLCPTYKKPFDIFAKWGKTNNKRRDWDSNPGGAFGPYTLSRRAP
jgi:site-specific DNA recombinase